MTANRSYKLKLYGNKAKVDTARYTQMRFNQYANMFLGRLFFGEKNIRTAGMGMLANESLYRSNGIIRSLRAAEKATKAKVNVPFARNLGCYGKLEFSKTKSFDYWVSVSNQLTNGRVRIPAKSHKALNCALKGGWKLSGSCEFKMINGNPYVVVFVSREVSKRPSSGIVGVDVGYKYSITDSNGYIGRKVSQVIRISRLRQAERRRQKHKISSKAKSTIKQILDIEAKRLIGRSGSSAFVVESPKRLANLTTGRLHGWARSYFANRLGVLCNENGIPLIEVSPYQTSITCSECGVIEKQSRVSRDQFECPCGYKDHADINAAKNIAQKGTLIIRRRKSWNPTKEWV